MIITNKRCTKVMPKTPIERLEVTWSGGTYVKSNVPTFAVYRLAAK